MLNASILKTHQIFKKKSQPYIQTPSMNCHTVLHSLHQITKE